MTDRPRCSQDAIDRDVRTIGKIQAVPAILQVVAHTTGLHFAAVARVTDQHWTACAVYDKIDFGLKPGGELVLESTICNEIRQHHQPVVFGHASADPRYASHPVPKLYGFESYISIPIFRTDGEFFGTLCALDPQPAKLDDPNIVATLELFAKLIAAELEAQERLESSVNALLDAHETGRLREQFVAVLGHDLRGPLGSIQVGVDLLRERAHDATAERVINLMQGSCDRIGEMIANILDFARGRLGGGIATALQSHNPQAELQQVIAEVRSCHPDRVIEVVMRLERETAVDGSRIAQLLANLLGNAIAHGAADQPVRVEARSDASHFRLVVSNAGTPIPREKLARLFLPFQRAADAAPQPGLGLGLYIAAQIAKAHGGELSVVSNDRDGTRFSFCMPIAPL